MDDIITYETLYEMLRREKYSQELEEIDKDFYARAVKYLMEKQKLVQSQKETNTVFAAEAIKTQRQMDNAMKLIQEIYERRENKITQLALLSSRLGRKETPPKMLPEEKRIYDEVFATMNRYRSGILHNILSGKVPNIEEDAPKAIKRQHEESEHKLMRFTSPVPKFVAEDLKTYGPFEAEDLATIPARAAEVIVTKKRGEEIKNEAQQENS